MIDALEPVGDSSVDAPALAERFHLRYCSSLDEYAPSADFTAKVPITLARRFGMIGMARLGDRMPLAVSQPDRLDAVDILERLVGGPFELLVARTEDVNNTINRCYQARISRTTRARPANFMKTCWRAKVGHR